MSTPRTLASLALAAALATAAERPLPASADATPWIVGGAAAAAATLLIINHNKQVHAKYAAYDHQVAAEQAAANDAAAAYRSERQAYQHEAALVAAYKHETTVQHRIVVALERQLGERGGPTRLVADEPGQVVPSGTSYGWGTL
ncbi:MAG: hypothetical protein ABSD03_13595 [Vulcanimicrobiaceae bacterium]|jgi:hypothetical protein